MAKKPKATAATAEKAEAPDDQTQPDAPVEKSAKTASKKCARNFRDGSDLYERGEVYDVPASVLKRHARRFVEPSAKL